MKRLACTLIVLSVLLSLDAATYYVDYATGNDASNGTKVTPWKRAPGMQGFGGKYTHTSGDRFIFKGGVTWPTSCFQWRIPWSGTAATRDYYGADVTWFTGPVFKRPVFDFERRIINGWTVGAGVLLDVVKYVDIDNLEFANHATPLAKDGIGIWGTATICANACESVTLSRCVVRDWWQPNQNGAVEAGTSGGGGFHKVNGGSDLRAVECEFHQLNAGVASGTALWNIVTVERCHIHHTPTAIMSANVVRDNYIHDLPEPGDPAAHSNAMLCNGAIVVTGNLIHDTLPRAQVIFCNPGYYGSGWALIQSNTVFNVAQPCIAIDTDGKNDPAAGVKLLNNVLVGTSGSGYSVRVGDRANGPLGALEMRGNRFVSSRPLSIEAPVNTLVNSGNITNTLQEAFTAGLSPLNKYGASLPVNPSVDPVTPPPIDPPPVVVDPSVTNYVTVTLTNFVTQTNVITQTVTLTNYVTAPGTNALGVLFEGKIIYDGVWTQPK